jgi:hypothetical protein
MRQTIRPSLIIRPWPATASSEIDYINCILSLQKRMYYKNACLRIMMLQLSIRLFLVITICGGNFADNSAVRAKSDVRFSNSSGITGIPSGAEINMKPASNELTVGRLILILPPLTRLSEDRPKTLDWIALLERLTKSLKKCAQHSGHHQVAH